MEYLIVWLIGVAVFAGIEAVTYQMVSVWFAIGSIGAFLTAYAGLGLNQQLAVFIILSIGTLLLLRPLSMKLLKRHGKTKTNVDALAGREVLITQRVDNRASEGEGRINGLSWTVRSADSDVIIEKGETAIIERVEGVKLIVKKKEK
ncbi:MAG: NfeD family protein [bacterium]|nr:NfeD family protein [bacterium]